MIDASLVRVSSTETKASVVILPDSDCAVTLHVDTGGVVNSTLDTPRMLGSRVSEPVSARYNARTPPVCDQACENRAYRISLTSS